MSRRRQRQQQVADADPVTPADYADMEISLAMRLERAGAVAAAAPAPAPAPVLVLVPVAPGTAADEEADDEEEEEEEEVKEEAGAPSMVIVIDSDGDEAPSAPMFALDSPLDIFNKDRHTVLHNTFDKGMWTMCTQVRAEDRRAFARGTTSLARAMASAPAKISATTGCCKIGLFTAHYRTLDRDNVLWVEIACVENGKRQWRIRALAKHDEEHYGGVINDGWLFTEPTSARVITADDFLAQLRDDGTPIRRAPRPQGLFGNTADALALKYVYFPCADNNDNDAPIHLEDYPMLLETFARANGGRRMPTTALAALCYMLACCARRGGIEALAQRSLYDLWDVERTLDRADVVRGAQASEAQWEQWHKEHD